MGPQVIHLEVALEAADVVRASRELLLRRAGALFAAWCLLAGVVLYWSLAGVTPFHWQAGVAAAAIVFGPPATLVALVTWNARRQFREAEGDLQPIRYCFHDDGIDVASEKRSGWIPWEAFQEAVEIPSAFLVFLEKDQHYLVPKRCFAEPAEIALLRSTLKSEVRRRKKRR